RLHHLGGDALRSPTVLMRSSSSATADGVGVGANATAGGEVVASRSSTRIRPPGPVPRMALRSMPRSWAILRTSGLALLSRSPAGAAEDAEDAALVVVGVAAAPWSAPRRRRE